jgi:SAM-dependent methyltransferase|tara:strand:- start:5079 stop:5861 length:783 start_codon:yes stop_codon:yes gene_type:complete
VERELADKLRNSSKEDRRRLYTELYDELFRRIPDHPQLHRKSDPELDHRRTLGQARFLTPLLADNSIYLELGPGACALVTHIAGSVEKAYAVDVSNVVTEIEKPPANMEFVLSDGTSVPVPASSVDLAFSNQLMEHLHPDDATEQLAGVYRALKPGGRYLCITPSRLSGPHDVSQHYDTEACGFHLMEYTYTDLVLLCRDAGFRKFAAIVGYRGWGFRCPISIVKAVEAVVQMAPGSIRRWVGRFPPVRLALGVKLIATK